MYKAFCVLLMFFFSCGANAEPTIDSVVVSSTQKKLGAVWTRNKATYFKSFDAVLLNGGKRGVELGNVCYRAYDAKGNSYKLDTIDEDMSIGLLRPGGMVHGIVQFTSEDEGVYSASLVKILLDCK